MSLWRIRGGVDIRTSWLAGKAKQVTDVLQGRGSSVLFTLSGIALALMALSPWWLVPGVVLGVSAIIFEVRLKPSYADLVETVRASAEAEKATSDALQVALESMLRRVSTHLELNEAHQRISVYCHVGHEFVMLARHSRSPRLAARGRSVYPEDQGVIGEAWDRGSSTQINWPEDKDVWLETQRDLGIPVEVARAMKMCSRSMVARRLEWDDTPVGVIVMESEHSRGVQRAMLDRAEGSLLLDSLSEILRSAAPCLPAVAEHIRASAT